MALRLCTLLATALLALACSSETAHTGGTQRTVSSSRTRSDDAKSKSKSKATVAPTDSASSETTTSVDAASSVARLEIAPGPTTLVVGNVQRYVATAIYANGKKADVSDRATWSVSDAAVAALAPSERLVGAIAVGATEVSAVYAGSTARAALTVTDGSLVRLTLSPEHPAVPVQGSVQFTATGEYQSGMTKDLSQAVTWTVEDPGIAVIDIYGTNPGQATGLAIAQTFVKATVDSVEAQTTLTVTAAQLLELTVTPANEQVVIGSSQQLTLTGFYDDNTTRDLTLAGTWTASAADVASFSATAIGRVAALKVGATTITATYGGLTAAATLTVANPPVASIAVTSASSTILVGATHQLVATATFASGSSQDVSVDAIWTSDQPTVVTVQNAPQTSGLVTAVSAGTATVTAAFGGVTSPETTFTVNLPTYTVDVTRVGAGSGSVAGVGIDCGADCVASYDGGQTVTLTATAPTGATFVGWSGACTNATGPCTFNITQDSTVLARFDLQTFVLTANRSGSGIGTVSSSPSGVNCGTACSATYDYGTSVTLTAAADSSSSFTGWTGACTHASATCTVAMSQARNASATFMIKRYALTVTKLGAGSGTITSAPTGISCAGDCTEEYDHGVSVTLTASPNASSVFDGWSGACSGTAATCMVSMSQARNVTATFKLKRYTLAATKAGSGTGVVNSPVGINCGADCAEELDHGTAVSLTANPDSSSTFSGWNGACSGTATTCTVSVTHALSVTATFALKNYSLSVTKAGEGTGSVTSDTGGIACGSACAVVIVHGTTVTLTATADTSSDFAGWDGPCTNASGPCTFVMTEPEIVVSRFIVRRFPLTVVRGGAGVGSVTSNPDGIACGADCAEDFPNGSSVTLTATPAESNVFSGWSGACANATGACTVSMTQARSVTASFLPAAELADIYSRCSELKNAHMQAPLPISDAAQLAAVESGKHYMLTKNIVLSSAWRTLPGKKDLVIDGNGFTISGLRIEQAEAMVRDQENLLASQHAAALFAKLECAVVRDLIFDHPSIVIPAAPTFFVAATLAGSTRSTLVDGVKIIGADIRVYTPAWGGSVGGLVGAAIQSTIKNSRVSGTVRSNFSHAGGIAVLASGTITDSVNEADVGVIGEYGEVGIVGGIVAIKGSGSLHLERVMNFGRVYGGDSCGGILASNHYSDVSITDAVNAGAIDGIRWGGGIVGHLNGPQFDARPFNSSFTRVLSVATLPPRLYGFAPLIGEIRTYGNPMAQVIFVASFWNGTTSGYSGGVVGGDGNGYSIAGATGKSTAELANQATYIGWDFGSTWVMDATRGHPVLKNAP